MDKNTIIAFDWIGSILMLGSIWGWIYAKLSPAIDYRLIKSERRVKALWRLLIIKSGVRLDKEDSDDLSANASILKRFRLYRAKVGVNPETHSLAGAIIMVGNQLKLEVDSQNPTLASKEYQELQQYKKDRDELFNLYLRYIFTGNIYKVQYLFFKLLGDITYSVFSGTISVILFLVGFVLWNLSKYYSFFVP